jgi:hypothetical protein
VRTVVATLGWVGAALLLVAYALVSRRRLEPNEPKYQLLNLFGGAGLAINSATQRAWPSVVVNIIWIGIGLFALRRAMGQRR